MWDGVLATLAGVIVGSGLTFVIQLSSEKRHTRGVEAQLLVYFQDICAAMRCRLDPGSAELEPWRESQDRLRERLYSSDIARSIDPAKASQLYDAVVCANAALLAALRYRPAPLDVSGGSKKYFALRSEIVGALIKCLNASVLLGDKQAESESSKLTRQKREQLDPLGGVKESGVDDANE